MTSISSYTNISQTRGNDFQRSNSRSVDSSNFQEQKRSRRRGGGRNQTRGNRQNINQQMGNLANNQTQNLRSNGQSQTHVCPGSMTPASNDSNSNNQQINDLLQSLSGNNSLDQLLQGLGGDSSLDQLLQGLGGDGSLDQLLQGLGDSGLLEQLGLTGDGTSQPTMPVEPDNGIGDGAGPIPTDDTAAIQSLLDGFDTNQLNDLLQMFSADDLAQMLSADGTNVSGAEISQLLSQLGLTDGYTSQPMPVEPDNGIGDGAEPIPADDTAAIQSVLDGFDTNQLNDLLQMFSADDLAQMLSDEGTSVSGDEITQLLSQLGLIGNTTTNSGDGSTTTTGDASTTNPVADNSTDTEIQILLQQLNSSEFSSFFDAFSVQQLADMLSLEGTNVSANEVSSLLAQLGIKA